MGRYRGKEKNGEIDVANEQEKIMYRCRPYTPMPVHHARLPNTTIPSTNLKRNRPPVAYTMGPLFTDH